MRKFFSIFILILIVVLGGYFYWHFYWVFGKGVKAGQLNKVEQKGILFKTYEGRIIQAGFQGGGAVGSVQSNEFVFSIQSKEIADKLMVNGGKEVQLHYTEYFSSPPWRGMSKYIVDSIITIQDMKPGTLPVGQ